jgi:hypothetical protein
MLQHAGWTTDLIFITGCQIRHPALFPKEVINMADIIEEQIQTNTEEQIQTNTEEQIQTNTEQDIQPFIEQEHVTPTDEQEEIHPLEVLHKAQEAAQKTYNDTLTQAKQDRDEAVAAAQKQYEQSLKAFNRAIYLASRR